MRLNSSPDAIRDLGTLPIKTVNGSTITVGDVAHVRDGFAPQTSVVRADGRSGVLVTLLKSAGASTLYSSTRIGVAASISARHAAAGIPFFLLFDQSIFVRAAV